MSSEIADALRGFGAVLSPALFQDTAALFAPLVRRPSPDFCIVDRDLKYGPHDRHRLDIFSPAADDVVGRAVVVYVHGGGFVMGDKGGPQDPFYNNVGAWAVRCGYIGVTLNYRLAPAAPWPAGAEDLATAIEWLATNIAAHGGNPERIFVMGQSAGAVHVASYIAGHHRPSRAIPVAGALMLSGLYDLTRLEHSPFEQAYFGSDATRFPEQSSLESLAQSPIPCLYTVSELDPPSFQSQAAYIIEAYRAKKAVWPYMLYLDGQNHASPIYQLSSAEDRLGADLDRFIRRFSR